jgi:hypothetical protein
MDTDPCRRVDDDAVRDAASVDLPRKSASDANAPHIAPIAAKNGAILQKAAKKPEKPRRYSQA